MAGTIIPALEVMKGGVQAEEIPQYIQTVLMGMITAVVMAMMITITERVIEGR